MAPALLIGDPVTATFSWKVTNIGTGIGLTTSWVDTVVASPNATPGDGDDRVLGTFPHTGGLAVNGSYTQTQTMLLPAGLQGRFHLFVRTDAAGSVFENGQEANNAAEAGQPFDVMTIPYADLVVGQVGGDSTGPSGQPLNISYVVTNQGIGPTSAFGWNDTVQLANDPQGKNIVASLDLLDHRGVLGVNGSYTREAGVILPNGISGTFYVVVSTAGPFEFIYTDNNTAISGPIQVTLTPPPDLTVTNITAPVSVESGQKTDISWTVSNIGAGDATGTWVDAIGLRPTGNPNAPTTPLGVYTFNAGLQAGKFYTRSEQVTLPAGLSGLYQVVVITNVTNSLNEHGATANNTVPDDATTLVTLPSRPDLQVSSVTSPASVSAGAVVALDFTVINQGTVATSGKWTDSVYLSLDNKISGDDRLIGSMESGTALDPRASYKSTTPNLTVPRRYRGAVQGHRI